MHHIKITSAKPTRKYVYFMTLFVPFSFTEGTNENIWNAFRKTGI
jgi:hypothetical protein